MTDGNICEQKCIENKEKLIEQDMALVGFVDDGTLKKGKTSLR